LPASTAKVVTNSTEHPSEDPVTEYHSDATGSQPKYIHLPSIGNQGFIQKVGVDQHQQIAVPTNIHLAGWFTSTVTPGDPGLSIIDGHLDGRSQPGIFAGLSHLKPGDTFTVGLANGTTRKFQVKTVQSLSAADAAAALFSQTPGISRQLNLITCSGTFSTSAGYDHRVIVTAQSLDFKN
jgi:LPXTG-site transpeptidase (sortase) family protein